MRHQTPRSPELYRYCPANSAPTTVDLQAVDVRRLHADVLIAELADLEERIRLLYFDDDGDGVLRPAIQDLVEAEYTILRELRRRETLLRQGIRWTTLRPRRSRRRWSRFLCRLDG